MEEKLSRRERKKKLSRQAILDAAAAEFGKKGFKDTSVADIMNTADLGIGTFYNYFTSKEEVLRVLLSELVHEVEKSIKDFQSANRPIVEILSEGSRVMANFLDTHRFVLPLFLSGSLTASADGDEAGNAKDMPALGFKTLFRDIILDGQSKGELRGDIPADLVSEMLHSVYQAAAFSKIDIPFQENVKLKINVFLDGLTVKATAC